MNSIFGGWLCYAFYLKTILSCDEISKFSVNPCLQSMLLDFFKNKKNIYLNNLKDMN